MRDKHVIHAMHNAWLVGFLDASMAIPDVWINDKDDRKIVYKSNHVYAKWLARDLHVLGYLLSPFLVKIGTGGGNYMELQLKYEEGSGPSMPRKLVPWLSTIGSRSNFLEGNNPNDC